MARKRKSKPTSKRRAQRQKLKDRYAHAREDAQLAGLIPTAPEEALKDERVDPKTQGEQDTSGIDRRAARNGWALPDHKKVQVVDRLSEIFEPSNEKPDRYLMEKTAKVLIIADQRQWERDNPQLAGQSKGAINVQQNQQNNALTIDPLKLVELMKQVEHCEIEARIAEIKPVVEATHHVNGTNGKVASNGKPEEPEKAEDGEGEEPQG